MPRDDTRTALVSLAPMLFALAVLSALGLVSVRAWNPGDGQKQIVFLCFGVAAALAAQWTSYRKLLALSPIFYALSLLPVVYTVIGRYVPVPLVHPVNNACHWIFFGPVSFQPSEVTKLTLIMLLAWTFRADPLRQSSWKVIFRTLAIAALPLALILQQPDLGTALTLLPALGAMILYVGVKIRHLLILALLGVLVAPILWFSGIDKDPACTICPNVPVLRHLPQFVKHYQRARVYAMFSDDPHVLLVTGYQQQRAMVALGSGGLTGKGAGNIPIGRGIPEAHNDMVVALIGEQFGLLGVAMLLLAYGLLFASGLAVAVAQQEPTGRLLAFGMVMLLAGQMMINAAVALRIMPVTGVTLPFVSYGGTSLVTSYLAVGLIINVARNQLRRRTF